MKSERLKKLEVELKDLQQWLDLGLVPKKDLTKHKEEIESTTSKIGEEKERLQFLKESGDVDDYIIPRKTQGRTPYSETPTIPDMDFNEEEMNEVGMTMDTETITTDRTLTGEKSGTEEMKDTITEDEDDPFSDKNRWRRGILDQDADNW